MTKHIKERNQLISNLFALSKINGKSVAETETALGVSKGYLKATMRSDHSIYLDLLLNACNLFGKTADELINGDFEQEWQQLQKQQHIADLEKQMQDIETELQRLKGGE